MIGSTNVRHLHRVPEIESVCGPLRILSTAEDCRGATVALLKATAWGAHHYHKETTEFYYVVSGQGHILLGEAVAPVRPGSFLVIPPGVGHQVQATAEAMLEVLVIATPAWRAEDEFIIESRETAQ